jgi:hypothetical protein
MVAKAKSARKKSTKNKYKSEPLLSNIKKPTNLSVNEWQIILRRQIAQRTVFKISNIGDGAVYSDYNIYNTATKTRTKLHCAAATTALTFVPATILKPTNSAPANTLKPCWLIPIKNLLCVNY